MLSPLYSTTRQVLIFAETLMTSMRALA